MTQAEFAAAIGEEAKAYSQWESDNNKPRHLVEVCQSVERVTGVSAAWLLGLVPTSGDGGRDFYRDFRRNGVLVPFAA
jgi:transcriptional regulator with XRE-family HTH domain